ncbi:DUF3943 domain-containing protein, partial [Corallococcus exercitus]|uniref:DUF3943 domain-containing protein n=1 Tax=Corallococcus exercitus TaxID=2316736 RepID=UPI0020A4F4BA
MGRGGRERGRGGDGSPWPLGGVLLAGGLLLGGPAFAQEGPCTDGPRFHADAAVRDAAPSPPADAPLNEAAVREDTSRERPHPWLALAEVTSINLVVWTWDRVLMNRDWARVTPADWGENLTSGFEWDGDHFGTNQLAHPYHGSLYYVAARDNGIPYLGSLGFTLLGSLQWEVFAENKKPSINDIANTSLGGTIMGEAIYRLSSMVLDTEATGWERFGRELGAAALSPVRGVNRVLRGDSWRVEPTPSDWRPDRFAGWARLGYLKLGNGESLAWGKNQFFTELSLRYGDAYRGAHRRPFDAFEGRVQFTTQEAHLISYGQLMGLLVATPLALDSRDELRLSVFQQMRYVNTAAYELGSQSVDVGLTYQHDLSGGAALRSMLLMNGALLASVSSEHAGQGGRNYDYGVGPGLQLRVSYTRDEWDFVSLEAGLSQIIVLDGSSGSHQVRTAQLRVDLPVYRSLGLGVEGNLFQRDSHFAEFPSVTKDTYQLRLFLSVH